MSRFLWFTVCIRLQVYAYICLKYGATMLSDRDVL